jgi:hypothetical protein
MEKELADAGTRLKGIFAKELVAANAALAKAKLDPIRPLTREDWEKKDSGGGGGVSAGGRRDPDAMVVGGDDH